MLKELKFLQGAAAKKDFIPELKHFVIENGIARTFNGIVAMSGPIPFDIDCKPRADTLVKAIANCKETVSLHMTPAGKLAVRSGPFKAFIECVHEETPHVYPEGDRVDLGGMGGALLNAFQLLEPFCSTDASRPWTTGILLRGQSAYATNNVTLVEYWLGVTFPKTVNIPRACIAEILRVDEPCIGLQIADKSITFYFDDGRWIKSALLSTEWPDLSPILKIPEGGEIEIPEDFYEGLSVLKPFADKHGRIFIKGGIMSTVPTHLDQEGASFEIPEFQHEGIYRLEMLQNLKDVITTIDFSKYPAPCPFFGPKLRGAIVGMRP